MTTKYLTLKEIRGKAEEILERTNVRKEPVIDITALATENGYKVIEVKFAEKNVSGMVVSSEDEKSIYIAASDSENRKRFTIAHELSHALLHHHVEKNTDTIIDYRKPIEDYRDSDELRREIQANALAAELLMPTEKTKELWKLYRDVEQLAEYFHVSRKAVSIRLDNLGLGLS